MTTHILDDVTLLDGHPRASMSTSVSRTCGDGVPQPGWGRCTAAATWQVLKPWGVAYEAHYCAEHAARIIRAADYLAQRAQLAHTERNPTP